VYEEIEVGTYFKGGRGNRTSNVGGKLSGKGWKEGEELYLLTESARGQ